MGKGCHGEEEEKKKEEKKRVVKIAVHYCGASQPPEGRPTGTPTSRAKNKAFYRNCNGW